MPKTDAASFMNGKELLFIDSGVVFAVNHVICAF